jgi:hypothetical protein
MYDSKRTVAVLVAMVTVVGFAVAPTATVAAQDDGLQTDQSTNDTALQADHGPFPHEVCTDLMGLMHENAPYDQLIWVSDLPDDAQPPGVPWTVITPKAVGGIVVAVTPSQCEIQDPNDPSWDPTREGDNLSPDGGGDVQQGENGEVLIIVNGTLDNTSEGPSGIAEAGLNITENGTLDPNTRINDGEKEYGVDPQLKYWSDGTTYFETDVYVIGSRLGGEMDCFGEECNFKIRGLPRFVDIPALPSPSDRERSGGDGDSGGDSDGGSSDGSGGADGSDGGADSGGPSGDDTTSNDGAGADGSGGADSSDGADGGSGSADGSGGAGSSGDGGDGGDGDGSGGAGSSGNGGANQQQSADNGGNQNAQQAAAADGTGLGILVALVVFILGAAAIAPRD